MNASLLDLRFIGLMALIGLLRFLIPQRFYVLFGVVASGSLLGWAAPSTFFTITAVTLLFIYPIHRLMVLARNRGASARVKSALLALGIVGLVALLVIFKAYRHFTLPWMEGPLISQQLLALVGFSYFIFRAVSFLHIQSILKIDERNPLTLLFYTLFPPTISAGPIQKFQDFRQQVAAPLPISSSLISSAAYRIVRGYFRKLVLAYILNELVQKLLLIEQPLIYTSLLTIVLLYLYFYFDFAGYSDIAIGFGLLLGIKVPENFRKPFLATTVSEFWRNWHITLVDWFRDNVFIPLGGMQSSRLRAAVLACLVMVLCGAWHGLAVGFLAWGAWHGVILAIEALSGSKPIPPALRSGPKYWSHVLWTNARVAFPCLFFLPNSDAMLRVLHGFLRWN